MKTKNYFYLLVMLFMCLVVNTSCGSDDEEEVASSITKDIIVGTWRITNISNTNNHGNWLKVGKEATFKSNGSCSGWFSLETAYKIEGGKLHTYDKDYGEPMFVYTLLSQNGNTIVLQMDGTLDDDSSCTLTLLKVK